MTSVLWHDDDVTSVKIVRVLRAGHNTGHDSCFISIVLQWEAFSLPELEGFLTVLNREEREYIDQVRNKFRLLKIQMLKKLREFEQKQDDSTRNTSTVKRKPVFV